MNASKSLVSVSILSALFFAQNVSASETAVYADYPVTLSGYSGDASTSVSYTGQIARHLLHNGIKKLAAQGEGQANEALLAQMTAYYSGKEAGRAVLAPSSTGAFKLKQTQIDEISKGKDLKSKTYKGTITGWPGNMTGPEVIEFMMEKAAATEGGFDPLTGYDYGQLISKFMMGAVFYHQAVDNYLDEKLSADNKPNDKPYKEGAVYTGKEHSWDEAFGYFGPKRSHSDYFLKHKVLLRTNSSKLLPNKNVSIKHYSC